jgi:hypothetical protein
MADRFEQYARYFNEHQPGCTWHQAQQAVEQQYARLEQPQHYAWDPARDDEDTLYEASHHPDGFEQGCRELGVAYQTPILQLDPSGLPVRSSRQPLHYERQHPEGTFTDRDLEETSRTLSCSRDEAAAFLEHYLALIRQGHPSDLAWSQAVATIFAESKHRPQTAPVGTPSSTITPPRHQQTAGMAAGGSGEEGYFVPSADPWGGREVKKSAPPVHGDTHAFKASAGRESRHTALGGPDHLHAGEHGLGHHHQREEVYYYQRGGRDSLSVQDFQQDFPGSVGYRQRPSGDGGMIRTPVYSR